MKVLSIASVDPRRALRHICGIQKEYMRHRKKGTMDGIRANWKPINITAIPAITERISASCRLC
jgi:hypothetical protein